MTKRDSNPDQADQRREPRRVHVSFAWYCVLDGKDTGMEGIARSCDLSQSGVGLLCPRPIAHGTQVFLELGLRGGRRISAVARVQFSSPAEEGQHRVGLALLVLPPNDRQALAVMLSP